MLLQMTLRANIAVNDWFCWQHSRTCAFIASSIYAFLGGGKEGFALMRSLSASSFLVYTLNRFSFPGYGIIGPYLHTRV